MSRPSLLSKLGKKRQTRLQLQADVLRAVRHIEENFEQPPTVSQLAEVAGLSLSHFQAAFKEVIGETPREHSNRLRLEFSAYLLEHSSLPVSDIALACGFGSHASFCRAFKNLWELNPKKFREKAEQKVYLHPQGGQVKANKAGAYPGALDVSVEHCPEFEVLSLRSYGKTFDAIRCWDDLLEWASLELDSLEGFRFFGFWFDSWTTKKPQLYRYEAGLLLPSGVTMEAPEPFAFRKVSAGDLARTQCHKGLMGLEDSWREFFLEWLPSSGYQIREGFVFEEYPNDFVRAHSLVKAKRGLFGPLTVKLHVPVTALPQNY